MVHVGQFFYLNTLLNWAFTRYLIRFPIRHFDGLLKFGQPNRVFRCVSGAHVVPCCNQHSLLGDQD